MKDRAREFAIAAHGDQKYGVHPYHVHLDAVAKIASDFGEIAEVIAYLHDVVEDTEVTLDEIENKFGSLVAESVGILTDESGHSRAERKSRTYSKMASVTGDAEIALVVKAADRLANLRACVSGNNMQLLAIYKKEHPVFKESVYRSKACDDIWLELEEIISA